MSTFLNRIREHFTDVLHIWRNEMVKVIKDEGVLMFLVVVPLGYPLLYSWIYNNETLTETAVAVVDQSHSSLSRKFINDCDATPDVHVKYYAQDLDEARSLVSRQQVRGIYLIPSDFATKVNRGEQATVSVYCDMSLMLAYKAVYQTAMVIPNARMLSQHSHLPLTVWLCSIPLAVTAHAFCLPCLCFSCNRL